MIYLYWYLGFCVGTMLLWSIYNHFKLKSGNQSPLGGKGSLRSEGRRFSSRNLKDMLESVLIGILVLPFFPVLTFFEIKSRISNRRDQTSFAEPEFAVTRDDLHAQMSLQEIEQLEMVVDPLGAVPNLPFGHLNSAWKKFCEGLEPQDNLWSFTAHWASSWGRKDLRQGYAIVRGEAIGQHFLTVWKYIDEDEDRESDSGIGKDGFDFATWLRKQAD